MAPSLLDHLVDTQMGQRRPFGEELTMTGLADARGAGDDDVGIAAGHRSQSCKLVFLCGHGEPGKDVKGGS